jgi:ATP-binding cassette subfamily C protein CydD
METLRIFGRGEAETENIRLASQDFRQRTMEVLRLAFLSSGVLEFFTSCRLPWWRCTLVSPTSARWILAITARRDPFRRFPGADPGAGVFPAASRSWYFYHAKAQAVGAADSLKTFLETPLAHPERGDVTLNAKSQ